MFFKTFAISIFKARRKIEEEKPWTINKKKYDGKLQQQNYNPFPLQTFQHLLAWPPGKPTPGCLALLV